VTTDEWDRGIITKVERALALRDELQAEQKRIRGGGEDIRKYSSTSNERFREDETVWMKWWLTKSVPPIPPSFAALLGDLVQNLRAVLEYSAWATASEDARATKPTQISFPLMDEKDEFEKWAARRAGWFNNDVVKVLEWAQPFHADAKPDADDKQQLHPLRVVRVLSNTDKHRLLNVVDHAHIEVGLDLDPMPPTYAWWTAKGPVAEGGLLAKLVFPRPPLSMAIDVRPSFGWYESVAYEEPGKGIRWLRLDEMMNAVCEFTVQTADYVAGARTSYKERDELPETGD